MISNKRNYIFTLFSGFGGLGFTIVLNLISIPISLNYWKTERYGIWVLLTSVLLYLGMSNLGLNTAAQVLMAKNPVAGDKLKILKRSLIILLFSVGTISLGFVILNLFTRDWIYLIGKIPENLKDETFHACVVLIVFYLASIPFSLLSAVYTGFQKAYIDNMFGILLNVMNFIVLILIIILKGNLVLYSILWGASLLLFNLSKYLFFYFAILKKLPLETFHSNANTVVDTEYKRIFVTGIRFFFAGIAATIVWNTDMIVISNFLDIKSVAPYFVTFRLFNVVFGIIFQVCNAVMPLMAKEFGTNNWDWISRIYNNLLVLLAIFGGASWIGVILFFRDIITLWAGAANYAGLFMVTAFGAYSYLLSMVALNAGINSTFNYTSISPYIAWAEALIKLSFSIILVKIWGIGGVAVGTVLGSLLIPAWILPVWINKQSEKRLTTYFPFIKNHFLYVILPLVVISLLLQNFITNLLAARLLSVLVFLSYFILSYLVLPVSFRVFFFANLNQIFKRIGVQSRLIDQLGEENPQVFLKDSKSDIIP
jgi:O-antigen/teichoic acid export membrane protein